jgi:adenylate cyclase
VNRRTQIKLRQLAILTIAWLLIGVMMTVYDYLVIHTNSSLGPSADYSFRLYLVMNMGSALVGSLLGGSLLIFFVNVKYQDKSYGYTLIAVSISFIIVILVIIVLLGVIFVPIRTGKPLSDPVSIEALKNFLTDTSRIKNILSWSVVVALTQLLLQINSKFGQGALGILFVVNTILRKKKNESSCFSILIHRLLWRNS